MNYETWRISFQSPELAARAAFAAWQAAEQEAAALRELPRRPLSPLELDSTPSFYASRNGAPPCTHRLNETDIPVWCRTADDASIVKDALCAHEKPERLALLEQERTR